MVYSHFNITAWLSLNVYDYKQINILYIKYHSKFVKWLVA